MEVELHSFFTSTCDIDKWPDLSSKCFVWESVLVSEKAWIFEEEAKSLAFSED